MNKPPSPTIERSKSFFRGVALTTALGVTLGLAQNADAPFVLTSSGIRIPNATLAGIQRRGRHRGGGR